MERIVPRPVPLQHLFIEKKQPGRPPVARDIGSSAHVHFLALLAGHVDIFRTQDLPAQPRTLELKCDVVPGSPEASIRVVPLLPDQESGVLGGNLIFGRPGQLQTHRAYVQGDTLLCLDVDGTGDFGDGITATEKQHNNNTWHEWMASIRFEGQSYPLTFYRIPQTSPNALHYYAAYVCRTTLELPGLDGKLRHYTIEISDEAASGDWTYPDRPALRSDQFVYRPGWQMYPPERGSLNDTVVRQINTALAEGKNTNAIVADLESNLKLSPETLDIVRRNLVYDWEVFGQLPENVFLRVKEDLNTLSVWKLLELYSTHPPAGLPAMTPEMLELIRASLLQNLVSTRLLRGVDIDGDGTIDDHGDASAPFRIAGREYRVHSLSPDGLHLTLEERSAAVDPVKVENIKDQRYLTPGEQFPVVRSTLFRGARAGEALILGGEENQFEGKIVLVDFWGTWCGPCIAALPKLHDIRKALHMENGASTFEILGIGSGADVRRDAAYLNGRLDTFERNEATQRRLKQGEVQYEWPMINDDEKNTINLAWKVIGQDSAYPTYYLVNGTDGSVIKRLEVSDIYDHQTGEINQTTINLIKSEISKLK